MALVGLFKGKGPNGFGYTSTADEVCEGVDLSGKTYLLTGCNSGLGGYTMKTLAARGARVIGAARTLEKAERACSEVDGETVPLECELSEPASVRAAVDSVAEKYELDGIIANAGIMALPERTVKHGLELQFLTNHIGHFILITGLVDSLTDDGRVVVLSSGAHKGAYPEGVRLDDLSAAKGYSRWGSYGQSKLANLLFAKELSTRLPKTGQTANSLHPGVIDTNLGRHMPKPLMLVFRTLGPLLVLKTVPQGSATQTFVAAHPDAAESNGLYYADCNPATPSAHGQDATLAAALWDKTEELVAELGA